MKKFIILFLIYSSYLFSQTDLIRSNDITENEIIYHIKYLSSDKLQGRRTGEKWCDSAGAYIEREFIHYGLKPFNNSFRQYYDLTSSLSLGRNNKLNIKGLKLQPKIEKDFIPLSSSSSGKVRAELIFAGYGISLPDSTYNDYASIDVKDKIVIILSGYPENDSSKKYFRYDNIRYKATIARDKGAKAIIFVKIPTADEKDILPKIKSERSSSKVGIPIIQITYKLAKDIFKSQKMDLDLLTKKINTENKPTQVNFNKLQTDLWVEIIENKAKTFNVIGYVEGNDPNLKNEYIIIGAHYDHLGLGGSGSVEPDKKAIHYGADDNASGTSGVLELAQYFSANKDKIGRTLIFMAFSGEEEGLLGSSYYMKNPLVPLEKTVAMINMDMIGRLKDNKLIVNGAGSSPIFINLLNKYNKDSLFNLKTNNDGFSPSDNSSFYGKNIPVMMFFTDLHPDYHKPSDTWDKINVTGTKSILELAKNVLTDLSNEKSKIEFVKAKSDSISRRDMPGFRVSTGIIPDFSEETNGVKIQGTRDGSPASKAGLKAGDIIIKLGNKTIKNLYDYTFALGDFKPGDKVTVIWLREGKEMTGEMELTRR